MVKNWLKISLITLLVAPAFMATGCGQAPQQRASYTKAELEKLIMGKTKDEVLQLLGRPESTQGDDAWSYIGMGLIYDPIAQKNKVWTSIKFSNGRVVRVDD